MLNSHGKRDMGNHQVVYDLNKLLQCCVPWQLNFHHIYTHFHAIVCICRGGHGDDVAIVRDIVCNQWSQDWCCL